MDKFFPEMTTDCLCVMCTKVTWHREVLVEMRGRCFRALRCFYCGMMIVQGSLFLPQEEHTVVAFAED